jgi:flavin-dependent dehydrogenase
VTDAADLLVIGGGPAGLATAIEAQLAGIDTLLIDRRKPPIDVACGEGLMPAGVDGLLRLGVELRDNEWATFCGIRYLDGCVVAEARFRNGNGRGVRRFVLHQEMRRRAEALGVRTRWGVTARALTPSGIETTAGTIRTRWLAAADGRMSTVRKMSGLAGRDPRRARFGVRRHYKVAPWSDFVEVHWADRAEAYVTPVGPQLVGVAILTSETPVDFDRNLERFPVLERHLAGAPIASRDRGAGPFGHRPIAVARSNLALVGDASGSLDPITGEGLSVAFAQARALIASITRGGFEDYMAEHRRILRTPRILTGLLLAAKRRPWLRRRLVRLFASSPAVFELLLDLAASGRRRPVGARSRMAELTVPP